MNSIPSTFSTAVLFSSYLPSLQYFATLISHHHILIEKWEHFVKQTYRNRCYIYSANGALSLIIPIQHGRSEHTIMKDVKIAHDYNWQKIHWKSIEAAYRCSPFFEFYEDEFAPFYQKKYEYLMDYNEELMDIILKLLDIQITISYTEKHEKKYAENSTDFRSSLSPQIKMMDTHFHSPHYLQVFSNQHGFIPNLSIIDLLCNEGTNAKEYLNNLK